MKVELSKIKSSGKRVRQSWDVEKLAELTQSITEQGLLVPVKLRPNGDDKYSIVFGHRRVAAAREAGLTEVDAIIEEIDDDTMYVQALTENVVREDMAALDIAKALKAIKDDTGWTNDKIGEMFGWGKQAVSNYMGMLPFEDDIKVHGRGLTHHHVMEAKAGTRSDEDAATVIEKAAREGLSQSQTREMADEYTKAKTAYGRRGADAVLKKPWLTPQSETKSLTEEADQILRSTPTKIIKTDSEILFSWTKDKRVIAAEQALKDISTLMSIMLRSGEDPSGAKAMIKNLRKLARNIVQQMDDILDELK